MITVQQIKKIQTLISKTGNAGNKEDMIAGFTGGRTTSVRELLPEETVAVIRYLNKLDPNYKGSERMRRKIISMAHEMQWRHIGSVKIDMGRVDGWCITFGFGKKKLDAYTYEELPKLVTQFTEAYNHYINKI